MVQRERLERHHAALGALSRSAALAGADLEASLHEITETGARTLDVGRVSVWLFDDDRTALRCVDLYERPGAHSRGAVVTRADHPVYFRAAESSRTVDVHDAATDPRTAELIDGYLRPLGIGALVDAPIVVGGAMIGVVCCEALGGARDWHPDELLFAGSLADFAAIAIERSRRAEAEGSLRARAAELRLALASARMVTWSYDPSEGRVRWSREIGPLFGHPPGWEPDPAALHAAMFADGDQAGVLRVIQTSIDEGRPFVCRYRIRHADGTLRWVESRGHTEVTPDGAPGRLMGTLADVDDVQRLQDQLFQAQKLEGLGRLAGGIAHDFNNLVNTITNCTDLLEEHVADRPAALPLLRVIERAADRATDLTRRLLAFARRQPTAPKVVDLAVALADSVGMLARVVPEGVRIDLSRSPEPLPVRIDPTQLEQIVVNLVVNAGDAMPDGGDVTIRTDLATVTPDDARLRPEALVGPHARLSVTDTGTGMDEATLSRAFEPFFTTKPEGKGTGLGLSTVYGIARQASGHLRVRSAPGQGSTFEVWFPLHEPLVAAPGPLDTSPGPD